MYLSLVHARLGLTSPPLPHRLTCLLGLLFRADGLTLRRHPPLSRLFLPRPPPPPPSLDLTRLVSSRLISSTAGSSHAITPRARGSRAWRSARRAGRGLSRGRTSSTSSGEKREREKKGGGQRTGGSAAVSAMAVVRVFGNAGCGCEWIRSGHAETRPSWREAGRSWV